ncbi:hypothetical protein KSX_77940 [Ktedonospora formicarum]|uniref:MrfA-like Zn-binding domain-containing protein n=2 Tax=Ktedonospora formicarum TaxID=2778364 RepID=A0A8J3MX51_9CHLR|nr:hypothetical protein KSX_77940 [Ktedonospora formicarum]
MSMKIKEKYHVGDIRPSQLLQTYGVGALIALPNLSALIMGLDDWDVNNSQEITEERLLHAIQSALGSQVKRLLAPPASEVEPGNPFSYEARIGVPVAAFPRWLVCPRCHLLAPVESGYFQLKVNRYQPEQTRYIHVNCQHQPTVLPSRFMIACEAGHLDDFPWMHFLHGDKHCNAMVRMLELGVSGEPSDILIVCDTCGAKRPMSDALSNDEKQKYHPTCTGRRPHLRDKEKACSNKARSILLAASNTWFPLIFSTLSLPSTPDLLGQRVENKWPILQEVQSAENIAMLRRMRLLGDLSEYSDDEIWDRVELKKTTGNAEETVRPADLKVPEWQTLSHPEQAPKSADFEVTPVVLPDGYEHYLEQVVLVERLREVRALTGFTRIESLNDYAEEDNLPTDHIMPLVRKRTTWVPASEVRGEGLFIQFREDTIQEWLQSYDVKRHNASFFDAHRRWRRARHIESPEANYPGIRYVLLHTFAHALIRQLTLESGYTAASIRERIYALPPEHENGPMAGILLYTAASDSEGTLGGLVSLGKRIGYHIDGAREEMQRCASDPLCAEHTHFDDNKLHGAACHACMFLPETSCERGNKYLDRSVFVPTVDSSNLAFFPVI